MGTELHQGNKKICSNYADDKVLNDAVKANRFMRCPACHIPVEKTTGCKNIRYVSRFGRLKCIWLYSAADVVSCSALCVAAARSQSPMDVGAADIRTRKQVVENTQPIVEKFCPYLHTYLFCPSAFGTNFIISTGESYCLLRQMVKRGPTFRLKGNKWESWLWQWIHEKGWACPSDRLNYTRSAPRVWRIPKIHSSGWSVEVSYLAVEAPRWWVRRRSNIVETYELHMAFHSFNVQVIVWQTILTINR